VLLGSKNDKGNILYLGYLFIVFPKGIKADLYQRPSCTIALYSYHVHSNQQRWISNSNGKVVDLCTMYIWI